MLSAGMASASVASLSSRYSDLRTHAIPAGVTARRSPRLMCAFLIVIFIILLSQQLFFCSKQRVLTIKVRFDPTLVEEKHEDSCGRSVKYGHVLRSEEHTSELQSRFDL